MKKKLIITTLLAIAVGFPLAAIACGIAYGLVYGILAALALAVLAALVLVVGPLAWMFIGIRTGRVKVSEPRKTTISEDCWDGSGIHPFSMFRRDR